MKLSVWTEHTKCQMGKPTSVGLMFELTAPTAPVIDNAPAHQPKALVFLVDRSGSMGGNRIEMAKQSIIDTLPRMNREDYVSVIIFDGEAEVVLPLHRVGNDVSADIAAVKQIESRGNTNLEAGYRLAIEEAKRAPRNVPATIILLSDGHANDGIVNPEQLGQIASAAIEHFITTSTIGVGDGYDETILSAIGEGGNGNHIAAIEPAEVVAGLQSEIDGLLQKTMLDFSIEIELGPEFNGRQSKIIAGRRMKKWEHGHGWAKANAGDLASGEEKNIVFELILDANPLAETGKTYYLQTVRWSYTDAITGEKRSDVAICPIEIVAANEWVEPQRDPNIEAELKIVRLQELQKRVWMLLEHGREDEANELLKQAGMELEEFMRNNNVSARSSSRLSAEASEFLMLSQMDDINLKRKRMAEHRNRVARDKRNFRDNN